jgi:hypothetical protein
MEEEEHRVGTIDRRVMLLESREFITIINNNSIMITKAMESSDEVDRPV